MYGFIEKESNLKIEDAIYDEVVNAGEGWMHELLPGQSFRILDMEGNQAVDTTFYDMTNPEDHYGAVATIVAQKNIYLTTGSILRSESGKPLLEITADLTGRHDTLGGACSSQSNTVRYAREKIYMHNCRDSFMLQLAKNETVGIRKRDLAPNINFFMNVPVTKEGGLKFDDGVSAPGKYVEMKALEHTMVLISNCPQLNNPCNAYNPTPVRLIIWDAEK
ncbi:urea amidolyase associated protein UAAP2 [uncultured Clostridium sp.]|uniref:urea amidolyase associated protein UAAP2 n=1 Tax=uncultured Clostridium sp. TaxID=59620 RepID=UPI0025E9092F|nr:urea amidolyase associated protein UAAP2 [uncultured Clostridium sp.]